MERQQVSTPSRRPDAVLRLDRGLLEKLMGWGGADYVNEKIEEFSRAARRHLENARGAARAEDWERLQVAARSLRRRALGVGAHGLSAMSAEVEQLCDLGTVRDVDVRLARIERELAWVHLRLPGAVRDADDLPEA